MARAFDDYARKHLGLEKGGPEGYDNGEFLRNWLFGREKAVGYKMIMGDRIVGAIIVRIFDTGKNQLHTIFVEPEYQNLGAGACMWAFIESTYPETKIWQLETPGFAIKNHYFYEKCGFRKVEVKPQEGDMSGEYWVYRKEMAPNKPDAGDGK